MYTDYLADCAMALAHLDVGEIEHAVRMIQETRDKGGMVWIVGNGGSAATAEHFAGDLVKMGRVNAVAVHSLAPTVLAFGNDEGWEEMYTKVLGAMARENDILVAISCSGASANVVNAASMFPHDRLIILTGNTYDSPLALSWADAKIFVPDDDIRIQEDAHLSVCHVISGALRNL